MKNEYKVTRDLMISWGKKQNLEGLANILVYVLWWVVLVCGASIFIIFLIDGGDWYSWLISILFLVLSIFKLFFSRSVLFANRYKTLSRMYGVEEWIRTTEFADDEIILTDHTSVTKLKYEKITKIKDKDNDVVIFFGNNLALRIYKDAFVDGSWQECKEKIASMIE